MASISCSSVHKYTSDQRSKSCDTVCSSNSSCYFQKRKPTHPLANGFRTSLSRSSGNAVRQRVLSAKLLKLRTLQSQLNDANFHLAELTRENQALKTLQKRQDKALSKYEGANADLPRLLQTHEEEIRVLTERNRSLRKTVKELNDQIKLKEDELTTVKEQLKHLEKLNKDKHLGEREKLQEQVEDLKLKVQKCDDQISTLNRKNMLESKNFKQKLNAEISKHKQCQRELSQALAEIDKLTGLLDLNKVSAPPAAGLSRKQLLRGSKRQSSSLSTFENKPKSGNSSEKNSSDDLLLYNKDLKLEPIHQPKDDSPKSRNLNGILRSPAENIKARLSSAPKTRDSNETHSKLGESHSSSSNGLRSLLDTETSFESRRDSLKSTNNDSRPTSSQKLEKLSSTIESTIQKAIENGSNEFELRLGDYCSQVVDTVKNCSEVINSHQESLKTAQEDTETIIEALKETDIIEKKLKHDKLLSFAASNPSEGNVDFIRQILQDELNFQKQNGKKINKDNNKSDKNKGPKVQQEDKKKLLATLKAIDNGDSVESVGNPPQKTGTLVTTELFGDIEI